MLVFMWISMNIMALEVNSFVWYKHGFFCKTRFSADIFISVDQWSTYLCPGHSVWVCGVYPNAVGQGLVFIRKTFRFLGQQKAHQTFDADAGGDKGRTEEGEQSHGEGQDVEQGQSRQSLTHV